MNENSNIGFIGLGNMGKPIFDHLNKKFSNIFCFDKDTSKDKSEEEKELTELTPLKSDSFYYSLRKMIEYIPLGPNKWSAFLTLRRITRLIYEADVNYIERVRNSVSSYESLEENMPSWLVSANDTLIFQKIRSIWSDDTTEWLKKYGFDFEEIHYTKHKWSIDVDVLIDDSPEKLEQFADRSVNHGSAICYKQTWNQDSQKKHITIDRLSDLKSVCFG